MAADQPAASTGADDAASRPFSRRLITFVIGTAVVLAGGIAITAHQRAAAHERWLTHPDGIIPSLNSILESGTMTVGRTYAQDTSIASRVGQAHIITLDDVRPVVVRNTAMASIHMDICQHRPGDLSVGEELLRETSRECLSVTPVAHQAVTLGENAAQLIAVITPMQKGDVWISGYKVAYHEGPRHQTQSEGIAVRFTAK